MKKLSTATRQSMKQEVNHSLWETPCKGLREALGEKKISVHPTPERELDATLAVGGQKTTYFRNTNSIKKRHPPPLPRMDSPTTAMVILEGEKSTGLQNKKGKGGPKNTTYFTGNTRTT